MSIALTLPLVAGATIMACAREAPAPPPPNVVTIVATDYAFGLSDTLPAGVTTFRLANTGAEVHHAVLIKLAEGKTLADFQAAGGKTPVPEWMSIPGSPAAIEPNDTSNTTITLTPGQYVLACFIPSPDGVPHIAKGMVRTIVVTGAPAVAAAEPAADVTMTLSDYTFALSTPLTAGTHTIRVENAGPQLHEVSLERLDDGKSIADWSAWAQGGMKGPAPAKSAGGVVGPEKGAHAFFTVDLKPGKYLLACYVPDEKDEKPHVAHGMVQEITIN